MIRVRPATDRDHQAWQGFLAEQASGDFLHDWAWADVSAFDGQSHHVVRVAALELAKKSRGPCSNPWS